MYMYFPCFYSQERYSKYYMQQLNSTIQTMPSAFNIIQGQFEFDTHEGRDL
jgi:hypothetical protein